MELFHRDSQAKQCLTPPRHGTAPRVLPCQRIAWKLLSILGSAMLVIPWDFATRASLFSKFSESKEPSWNFSIAI